MGAAIAQQFTLDHRERVGALMLLSAFERAEVAFVRNFWHLENTLISGGVPASSMKR